VRLDLDAFKPAETLPDNLVSSPARCPKAFFKANASALLARNPRSGTQKCRSNGAAVWIQAHGLSEHPQMNIESLGKMLRKPMISPTFLPNPQPADQLDRGRAW